MAIVNINRRMTSEYEKFQKSKKSNDSLIYVDKIPSRSPHELSLDLHVGDIYEIVNQNKKYKISEQGLVLSPGQSILIEINEFIEIPNNIFGIVTGKGSKIFQGIFISTGKIDAGFSGHLKIAIYNGSNKKITLKKEDSLCSCIFLNMDTTVSNNVIKTSDTSVNIKKEPYYKRVLSTVSNNNQGVMPILYIITLIITILSNWDKIKNLFS